MDPDNRELMVHLMDLAAAERRTATLDTLTARYLRTEPADELPPAIHAYAALRALVLEPQAAHEQALSRLVEAGPEAILDALVRVAPQLDDLELSDRLAALLADPSQPPDLRAEGHLHRAWFAVARGRWRDAEAHWQAARSIQPERTLVYRVLTATMAHSPAAPGELDSLRAAVAAWMPGAALEDGLHEGDLDVVRTYLLGLLAWRARDEAALEHGIRDLAALASERATRAEMPRVPGTPGLAAALAATLEALEHWHADRQAQALAALDRAELRIPFHHRARSPVLEQHPNRFVRAEILRSRSVDRADGASAADADALRWYASLDEGYFHWGAPLLGPALLGSAEIHERHGRSEQADAAYRRFLELWADADPELHAWVENARRAAAVSRAPSN
jgi:hypothetical protein